jgi:hypothetical protein
MNQNSQNKKTIEDKIKVYEIKKGNENMNNDCKNEEINQASKKKDIQAKPNDNNNINNIVNKNTNNYYNIQGEHQELKERKNFTQSGDNYNNNYENTERQEVKIRSSSQPKKEDKECCCCCYCNCSCRTCLEEYCTCNCCSECCRDCSECFSKCGECLCLCVINSLSHCEIF